MSNNYMGGWDYLEQGVWTHIQNPHIFVAEYELETRRSYKLSYHDTWNKKIYQWEFLTKASTFRFANRAIKTGQPDRPADLERDTK